MYELDTYMEAQEDFPYELLNLETEKGLAKHFKTEILNKKIWYTLENAYGGKPFVLDLKDVKAIIQLNKRGEKPALSKYIEKETAPKNEMSVGTANIEPKEDPKKVKARRKVKLKRTIRR